MERKTVAQLKSMLKDRGLRGYSRLRKAELIGILQQSSVGDGIEGTRSLLDDPVPDITPTLVPTLVPRMITTAVSNVKDVVEKSAKAVTDWAEWLRDSGKEVVRKVSPRLRALKEKVNLLFAQSSQSSFEACESRSALRRIRRNIP